ncbi:PREDICTED: sporamin B-like [Ipomoea nil]|uniref:sporamin B-like n=1 Tax=Ipomoea nil TaxID=35883 RepID=UPI000901CC0B|nr:PREDICTED: sporamin B-like [Ipomoea nil]
MKTLTALLFALSLYLLPNPTHSTFNPIRLPTADDTPVLDTDGDALRPGETYFITSTGRGAASGGVQLAWLDSATKCASNVVISRPLTEGDPIRITPAAEPNATVVLPSTFQSFAFFVATSRLCVSSVFWRIRYDQPSGQYFLSSGEFVSDISGQFKIEVAPELNAYKITYCPFGGHICYNVGRYFDESAGAARLALTEDFPFTVVFKKATF